jgi:hypothetical protein
MNVFEYVAHNNQNGAAQMVQVYNLRPERDKKMLARQVAYCVKRDRDHALKMLAKIHPDADLFTSEMNEMKLGYEKKISESQSKLEELFTNMNGQAIKGEVASLKSPEAEQSKKSELLMVGGIIIISLALILKK